MDIEDLKARNAKLTRLVAEAKASSEAYAQLAGQVKALQNMFGTLKQPAAAEVSVK